MGIDLFLCMSNRLTKYTNFTHFANSMRIIQSPIINPQYLLPQVSRSHDFKKMLALQKLFSKKNAFRPSNESNICIVDLILDTLINESYRMQSGKKKIVIYICSFILGIYRIFVYFWHICSRHWFELFVVCNCA